MEAPKNTHDFVAQIRSLCIDDHDFPAAEKLFNTLLFDRLRLTCPTQESSQLTVDAIDSDPPKYTRAQPPLTQEEITTVQKSLTTLIRYAPSPEQGLKYAHLLLTRFDPPLRTAQLERASIINMIYIMKEHHMYDLALDYVKIGLERGILLIPGRPHQSRFDNPAHVFRSVCASVLAHHNLRISSDKISLEPKKVFYWT